MTDNRNVKFYKVGFGKNGQPAQRKRGLKTRLTVSETKVLSLFKPDDAPKTMADALVDYRITWPGDVYHEQRMSRDLNNLKLCGFLDAETIRPRLTDKQTKSYAYHSKMTFRLSEDAKTGKISIDQDRWVIFENR